MSYYLRAAYEAGFWAKPYRRVDPAEIDRLMRCGWRAVLVRVPSYCPDTDALRPGCDEYLHGPFRTLAEARREVDDLYRHGDDITSATIL